MYLINEENTWDDLSSSFFSPFGDLLVNLFSDFWLDLTNITSKEGHETLCSRVDDINLMKCYCVHDLFALLQLTLWALHIPCLWPCVIKVTAPGEGSTQLRDLARGLVDGDDVTGHDLFFLNGLNHLVAEIVDGLHLSGLQGNLSSLGSALDRLVNLNFDDLTFNYFSLLSDSHTN